MKQSGKKYLSDKVSRRPQPNRDVRRNPFELLLTKAKHVVAGRSSKPVFDGAALGKFQKKPKPGKKQQTVQIETQGLRSVSRNAAQANRKATLLKEFKTRTKTNKLVDRRLGEKDATMSLEDKMMERVMFERKQSAKTKRGIFHLRDDFDDELRFGQTLAELEREAGSDEEDMKDLNVEEGDMLGEKFVTEHHFGGGLLKKVSPNDERPSDVSHPKLAKADRTLQIEDIIAESKEKKYAKQSELDEIRDLTKSLDEKWGDIEMRKLISSSFAQAPPDPPVESYDSLVKKLLFETKAKASDKLKSDSELAKDAKEALEKAEKKRLKPDPPPTAFAGGQELELLEPAMDDISENGSDGEEEIELSEDEEAPEIAPVISSTEKPDLISGEIPFVIAVPEKRKDLLALLTDRSPDDVLIIVKRIMQYHHISLAEENRAKLTKFFRLLLDYSLTFADEGPMDGITLWQLLTPSLVELVRIAAEKGQDVITSRMAALSGVICKKASYQLEPSAIFFLKFVGICYPLTNPTQPVVASLNLLLGKIMSNSVLSSRRSLLTSLLMATLAAESVLASKRYFPELLSYLRLVLKTTALNKHVSSESADYDLKFSLRDVFEFSDGPVTPGDNIKSACLVMDLLKKLVPIYSGLPAYSEIFSGFEEVFVQLKQRFPDCVGNRINDFSGLLISHRVPRPFLTFKKKKPTALTLLEPRIDDKFDRSKSSKKSTVKKLQHDKKRAVKGAKRELRRDNQFIARVQLDEQVKKDAVRQKKVKEIFTNLYTQQSEHKAMQRQKAKFKI